MSERAPGTTPFEESELAASEVVVAIAQTLPSRDKASSLNAIQRLTQRAALEGADMVTFPEAAMISPDVVSGAPASYAESLDGPFVRAVAECAAMHRVVVVAGMFERTGGGRPYNTIIAIGSAGEHLGTYRKTYLYDGFGYQESATVQPGPGDRLTFDVKGMRFGLLTCYEVRFPELALELVVAGADALLVPAAWVRGRLKEMQWEVLLRARAIEGGVYAIGCGQAGGPYIGASICVDPAGVVRCGAGEGEELLVARLSRARLEAVRERFPAALQRRGRLTP